MRNPHEPHDDFVERLQWQIRTEARRRERLTTHPPASAPSRWRLAVAAVALAVVSMGVGGAIVAAASQAQTNQQRDLLAARYERRLELERERLGITKQKLLESQRRVQLGIAGEDELLDERRKVAEVEAALARLELQVQEVRITGQEPVDGVAAPLAGGRDFVSERWRIDITALEAAIQAERAKLSETTRRVSVGLAPQTTAIEARARVEEVEAALASVESRLALRQRFLKKDVDAAEVELRALEAEAQLRQQALRTRLTPARAELSEAVNRFNVGLVSRLQVAEAQLKVNELEADLAKAAVDLALVQDRLAKLRKGK